MKDVRSYLHIFSSLSLYRFWTYHKQGQPDQCWIWEGSVDPTTGYGRLSVEGNNMGAHIFALALKLGRRLVKGECSLHHCDIRLCVNPKHLFLGTKGDNNTDRCRKGRNANRTGSKNTQAKLNEQDVLTIRKKLAAGKSRAQLAKRYKVDYMTIHHIAIRKSWIHI